MSCTIRRFFLIIEPVLVISYQGSCSCNQPNTMSIFLMHFIPCGRVRITMQSRAGICINGPKVNCWNISWIFVWGCLLFFWMFWHAADLFLLKLGRLQNQRYQQHCAHKLHQPCKWKSMNVLGKRRWEIWHTVTPNLCVCHRVTDFQNTTTHPHTHWHTHARTKGNMGGLQLHYFIVSKCEWFECLWNTMQFFLGHKMDHITANLRWNGRATRSLWIQGVVCVSQRRHGQTTLASW